MSDHRHDRLSIGIMRNHLTTRRPHQSVTGSVLAFAACLTLAGFSVAGDTKPDPSEAVAAGSVWQGMSRVMASEKQKKPSQLFETMIKVTSRDGENVEFDYWITMGPNTGSSDRRGLHLTGTVSKTGQVQATPQKILAGAWQNPNLLSENWTGQVVAEKAVTRMVLHRPTDKVTIEIGVIKKK